MAVIPVTKTLRFISVLCVLLCAFSVFCCPAEAADDTAAINQLLDRMEQGYAAHDAQKLAECMHGHFVAVLKSGQPSGDAQVFDKKALLGLISGAFAKNATAKSHVFTQRKISVPNGWPIGTASAIVKDQWPDGRTQESSELRLFVREGESWKVILAQPVFFEGKAMAVKIMPGSQAGKLGLREGDIITYYGGEKIEEGGQLIQAVQKHVGDPPEKAIPLGIKRGAESLLIEARPGQLGCSMETRFFPLGGAEMIGAQTPHPVKEVAAKINAACRQSNVDQIIPEVCPAGAINVALTPQGLLLAGPPNPREGFQSIIQKTAATINWQTLECDQIRAIVQGPVAIVACRCRVKPVSGDQAFAMTVLYLYAKHSGRWYFISPLPGNVGADIGIDPPSPAPAGGPK